MKVYLGFDSRAPRAYQVAEMSLHVNASRSVDVTPLNAQRLAEHGLLRRPTDLRGQRYDIPSNAPASTEFAISRFLVPFLAQTGWALFADSDVVFLGDIAELFALADPRYAVQVVRHDFDNIVGSKMDSQIQTAYPRKLWSSVCLWNVDHPANKRLSLVDVQERPGRDLHAYYWLHDSEIGSLDPAWNWLVGMQPMPKAPKLAHFTNGGPFLPGWQGAEHDNIWLNAEAGLYRRSA